jgi:uncharacterized membrane protein
MLPDYKFFFKRYFNDILLFLIIFLFVLLILGALILYYQNSQKLPLEIEKTEESITK